MASVRAQWSGTGAVAGKAARQRQAMKRGVVALAQSHAARAESTMKTNAPWDDQTANARQGLFGEAAETAEGAVITLGGTAEYQPHLEFGTIHMAPRPIIGPTAQTTGREASEDLVELGRRFGG